MPKIFISYRRSDSDIIAGRIYDKLSAHFGESSIFFDVEAIDIGRDFREALQDEVRQCQVLIAVIGPNWLNVQDEDGCRRIDTDTDWVRIEIESALARNIRVIPLLVKDASLPKARELPEGLKELAYRQAAKARSGADFTPDMNRLIRYMERHFATYQEPSTTATIRRFTGSLWLGLLGKVKKRNRQDSGASRLSDKRPLFLYLIIFFIMVGIGGSLGWSIWRGHSHVTFMPGPGEPPDSTPAAYNKRKTADQLISTGGNHSFEGMPPLNQNYPEPGTNSYKTLKKNGVRAFADGNYADAVNLFGQIRTVAKEQRRLHEPEKDSPEFKAATEALKDPEVLIFQNNAIARKNHREGQPIYTIVAGVPLTNAEKQPFTIGQEMLRGIAQAQDKVVNAHRSMPALNLQVIIANDRNIPSQAVASALAALEQSNSNALAAVGHYTSDSSCEALKAAYSQVVMISPLSTRTDLRRNCSASSFFFRTTSSTKIATTTLMGYLIDYLDGQSIVPREAEVAIFYNPDDSFSKDMFIEFQDAVNGEGMKFKDFQLSASDFSAPDILETISSANALIMLPDGRNTSSTAFDNAVEVIKQDSQTRPVLGANPLYNSDTIEQAGEFKGLQNSLQNRLFLASDWHQDCAPDAFVREIEQYWFGGVNRASILSYEAVQVLAFVFDSLRADPTVHDVRDALANLSTESDIGVRSHGFVNKTISFDDNGDRVEIEQRLLVTVGENENKPFIVLNDQCLL